MKQASPSGGPAAADQLRPQSGFPTGRRVRQLLAPVTALGVVGLLVLVAGPASAATGPVGPKPARSAVDSGPGLSVLQTILLYVVTPLVLFTVIALLASAGSIRRGGRAYRGGDGWDAPPAWFNGPALVATGTAETRPGPSTLEGGGASARW